jgi:hypothetical protein
VERVQTTAWARPEQVQSRDHAEGAISGRPTEHLEAAAKQEEPMSRAPNAVAAAVEAGR